MSDPAASPGHRSGSGKIMLTDPDPNPKNAVIPLIKLVRGACLAESWGSKGSRGSRGTGRGQAPHCALLAPASPVNRKKIKLYEETGINRKTITYCSIKSS
jgi:hypothetical protein